MSKHSKSNLGKPQSQRFKESQDNDDETEATTDSAQEWDPSGNGRGNPSSSSQQVKTKEKNSSSSNSSEHQRLSSSKQDSEESTTREKLSAGDDCPECTGTLVKDDVHGDTACEDCGLIIDDDHIDHGPEWRSFNAQQQKERSRVGSPLTELRHDKGLSTEISWQNKDGYGNSLNAKKKHQMRRLRKLDKQSKTKNAKERTLRNALTEIQRMSSALGLPDEVRTIAANLFKQAHQKDLLIGRSIEGIASASLYTACRVQKVPRTLEEVESVSRIEKRRIGRAYQYLNRELELNMGPPDPRQYLSRYTSRLDLPQETERLAKRFLDKAIKQTLHNGKLPAGLAASAIYMASIVTNESISQKDIADATDVTEVTIREGYQEMIDAFDESILFRDIQSQ